MAVIAGMPKTCLSYEDRKSVGILPLPLIPSTAKPPQEAGKSELRLELGRTPLEIS